MEWPIHHPSFFCSLHYIFVKNDSLLDECPIQGDPTMEDQLNIECRYHSDCQDNLLCCPVGPGLTCMEGTLSKSLIFFFIAQSHQTLERVPTSPTVEQFKHRMDTYLFWYLMHSLKLHCHCLVTCICFNSKTELCYGWHLQALCIQWKRCFINCYYWL